MLGLALKGDIISVHRPLSIQQSILVHSVHRVHSCPCPSSIKKSFTKKKILGNSSTKFSCLFVVKNGCRQADAAALVSGKIIESFVDLIVSIDSAVAEEWPHAAVFFEELGITFRVEDFLDSGIGHGDFLSVEIGDEG